MCVLKEKVKKFLIFDVDHNLWPTNSVGKKTKQVSYNIYIVNYCNYTILKLQDRWKYASLIFFQHNLNKL